MPERVASPLAFSDSENTADKPSLELRAPSLILKVVKSFREAAIYIPQLSFREIGGICVRGAVHSKTANPLMDNPDLFDFANRLTRATAGDSFYDFRLRMRRQPRSKVTDERVPTLFSSDQPMHFDGFYTEKANPDGSVDVTNKHPLLDDTSYHGVSHHLTTRGHTNFIMERARADQVTELACGQQQYEDSVLDTNPYSFPIAGESITLEAGDYVAFHAYGVYESPLYVHGTLGSTEERVSVSYQAHENEYAIDSLPKITIARERIE